MNLFLKCIIDFAAIVFLYVFLYRKWKNAGKTVVLANTIMYLYLTVLLCVTLMPIITSLPFIFNHPYGCMNLVPFDDFLNNRGDIVRQIILNMIMTVPFGFLFPVCRECSHKKHGLICCLLLTAGMSICIELLQPLINGFRSCDITDVINNTFGGGLGYLVFLLVRPMACKIMKCKNK